MNSTMFSGSCSPVRIKRKRFPSQICMAQLKTPNSHTNQNIFDKYCDVLSDDEEEEKLGETENLRLHHQRSWLSLHTSDPTLLSLRSMTSYQRKSFRALFDILDNEKTGIVCLNKLKSLLCDLGAQITLSTLRRVCNQTYATKYPHLTFIQFCALLLRDDIRVRLRNTSMDRINHLRFERQQYLKNMQYIKDTPTESQQRIIDLRRKLDDLETRRNSKIDQREINMLTSRTLNGSHEIAIPISVFIQSWHRKQLLKELEQKSYLSNKTMKRTETYVTKSTTNKQLQILTKSKSIKFRNAVDDCMSSRRMLLNTLDSAINREQVRSGKQVFSFDNVATMIAPKKLNKSYSASVLSSKQFDQPETKPFGNAIKNAIKQIDNSLNEDFKMYSLKKNKDAMKYEILSSYNTVNPSSLQSCFSSPSFEGVRKTSKKTPAERFLLKRNSTLPKLLIN